MGPSSSLRPGTWELAACIPLLVAAAGCECGADGREGLGVWGPASLVDVLPRAVAAFDEHGSPPVRFSFDATSRVARQVMDGAPADVFVSADERWMDHLQQAEAILPSTRTRLVGNALVVVAPSDRDPPWRSLGDLPGAGVERLVLGGEAVPVGRYAEHALRRGGVWEALDPKVVRADHARAVLAWVARGEVDAGIVYRTDARAAEGVRVVFEVPAAMHPPIVYSAAVVRGASHPELARELLRFLRSEQARGIFESAGFRPVREGTR